LELDKKQIGLRIRSIRESFGWKLEDFGELVFEASKGTVSNWENGVNIPSKKRLERIAILGKTDVNWILHGTLDEYVRRLFSYMKPLKFSDEFYEKLVGKLRENKIKYEDIEAIFQSALEINPDLRDNTHFHYLLNNLGTSIEKVSYYDIEEDKHFRQVYLPMLSRLFKQEEEIDNPYDKNNDQILRRIIDLLDRLNYDSKANLNELMTELSWILTKNIFITDITYLPTKYASSGGFNKTDENTMFGTRSIEEAKGDYVLLREKILKRMDKIFLSNANDFYNNKKRY